MAHRSSEQSGCGCAIIAVIGVIGLAIWIAFLLPTLGLLGGIAYLNSGPSDAKQVATVADAYFNAAVAQDWKTASFYEDPTTRPLNGAPSRLTSPLQDFWTRQETAHGQLLGFTRNGAAINGKTAQVTVALRWTDGTTEERVFQFNKLWTSTQRRDVWRIAPDPQP